MIPRMNHRFFVEQLELLDGTDSSKILVLKSLVGTLQVLQEFDLGFLAARPRRLGRVAEGLFVYSTALVDQNSTILTARLLFWKTLV